MGERDLWSLPIEQLGTRSCDVSESSVRQEYRFCHILLLRPRSVESSTSQCHVSFLLGTAQPKVTLIYAKYFADHSKLCRMLTWEGHDGTHLVYGMTRVKHLYSQELLNRSQDLLRFELSKDVLV